MLWKCLRYILETQRKLKMGMVIILTENFCSTGKALYDKR